MSYELHGINFYLNKFKMDTWRKYFAYKAVAPEIKVKRWLCVLLFANAITIYPYIYIRKVTHINKWLLNHELIHWFQQEKIGLRAFIKQYIKEFFMKLSYKRISFEAEAFKWEWDVDVLNNLKIS